MGAGCSNKRDNSPEKVSELGLHRSNSGTNNFESANKKTSQSIYQTYQYKNSSSLATNLLMYTSIQNFTNEFTVLEGEKKETNCINTSKINGVAVGYYKGYKLDVHNQDKFFVLIDGTVEIYCLVDGHGPYGNVIGQIVQDNFFKEIKEIIFENNFDENHVKIFKNIFEKIHNGILEKDDCKFKDNYDSYLSGVAVTLIIKKDNAIYCANVGNVLALLFYAERIYSYKFKIKELTFNDSSFKAEFALYDNPDEDTKKMSHQFTNINPFHNNLASKNTLLPVNISHSNTVNNAVMNKFTFQPTMVNNDPHDLRDALLLPNNNNVHKNFDINEELRRIYECGGEIRKLAGEEKSRIFVKGKYFPGLINTRSLGDQIGVSIGVSCVPHIYKYNFQEKNNYYLIMCSDGITNVLNNDTIVNIIENTDVLPLESINSIIKTAKQEFRKNSYCPDMTIILKGLNTKVKMN